MFIKFSSNDKQIIVKESKLDEKNESAEGENILYLDDDSDDRRVKAILEQKNSEKKNSWFSVIYYTKFKKTNIFLNSRFYYKD